MIFNSISKEIGNSQLRHTSYQPHDYQPSNGNHSRLSNQDYISNSRISDPASSISQMNQKITENLDYLKYKDYSRGNQFRDNHLRGSRVSNRSNHSRQSHQSNRSNPSQHSIRPRVEVASNFRFNEVRTPNQQHYFPQRQLLKPQFSAWEGPMPAKQKTRSQPQEQPPKRYKQLQRNPITIEEYNHKYTPVHTNPNNSNSIGSQMSRGSRDGRVPENDIHKQDTRRQNDPKLQENINQGLTEGLQFQMFREESNRQQESSRGAGMASSGSVKDSTYRESSQSFGQKFSQQVPLTANPTETGKPYSQSSFPSMATVKDTPEIRSPLPSPKNRRDMIIVASTLVALGLLLFILQISK